MDILSDILSLLKVQGTLYFRSSWSPPWGVEVPAFRNVARFHHAHRGSCWFSVEGVPGEQELAEGDLLIIPHGARHALRHAPGAETRTVDQVVEDSGFSGRGTLVYGGHENQDLETQMICGHFAFAEDASHPLLEALPPYIHIKKADDIATLWLDTTLKLLGSVAGRVQLGSDIIAIKLAEVIFTQAIRAYLLADESKAIIFRGLKDPQINRVLGAIHEDWRQGWTLDSMGRVAGLSRTVFAERFRALMGMTPMQYLTMWRMQHARQLLVSSDQPVVSVAEQSGYLSEAAFSRAFKQHFDKAPATYRREAEQPSGMA